MKMIISHLRWWLIAATFILGIGTIQSLEEWSKSPQAQKIENFWRLDMPEEKARFEYLVKEMMK